METLYRLRLDGNKIAEEKIGSIDSASPGDVIAHEESLRVIGRRHFEKLRRYTICEEIRYRISSKKYETSLAEWSRMSMEVVKAMLRSKPEDRLELLNFAHEHGMSIEDIVKEANKRGLKDVKDVAGILVLLGA